MSCSVLYVYEGFKNPGDSFSYCGARHYIHQTIPVVAEQGVNLRSTRDLLSRLEFSGPDLLVFAGAPWFWEGCSRSVKYAGAHAMLQMHKDVRKLAVGVGSCFLAGHSKERIEAITKEEAANLRQFWGQFDTIIVRDVVAWWMLAMVGVESILAPCPSVAVGEWFGRMQGGSGTVILSENLEKNFMYAYLSEADRAFYQERVARLLGAGASEMPWIAKDRSTLASRSLQSMCREIASKGASTFFTARVHAALVAMGMGLRGELMALDSRALSARLFGAELVGRQAEAFCRLSEDLERSAPSAEVVGDAIRSALEGLR